MFKNTEKIDDKIPIYHNDKLNERFNEAVPKKNMLTLKENEDVMKKLNLNYIKKSLAIQTNTY